MYGNGEALYAIKVINTVLVSFSFSSIILIEIFRNFNRSWMDSLMNRSFKKEQVFFISSHLKLRRHVLMKNFSSQNISWMFEATLERWMKKLIKSTRKTGRDKLMFEGNRSSM